MRIIRHLDENLVVRYASLRADGPVRIVGDIFGAFEVTGEPATVQRLLAPVAPTDILGIGRNYVAHGDDGGSPPPEYPIVFMKTSGSVQDPGGPIALPHELPSDDVRYEGELAVVIGTRCRNVRPDAALDVVLGYTCANDVTARDWQARCGQWWRGKSFDTFSPLGPCLVLRDEIPDPSALWVRTLLNGRATQEAPTSDMIFDVPSLIAFLSAETTLSPGTVILTGTPPRIRLPGAPAERLVAGDEVVVEIDGIGRLVNPVTAVA